MKFACLSALIWCFTRTIFGQDSTQIVKEEVPKKLAISGYLTEIYSVRFEKANGLWANENIIHNRINFTWNPSDNLKFELGVRNRIFTGEYVKFFYPNYSKSFADNIGWQKLSTNITNDSSVLINSFIDRFYLEYQYKKWSFTIGRQRVNWGQNYVWNPNDIFNNYSLFDFDYPERPGSDAIRIKYFSGVSNSFELAAKINRSEQLTLAGLYKFSKFDYDFQFLTGVLDANDYVFGAGWSGNIKGAGFRGELTYLLPLDNKVSSQGMLISSISADYTFSNSLMLQFEFLYNQKSKKTSLKDLNSLTFNAAPQSVRNLMFTEYNLFFGVNYNLSSLLKASINCIYLPEFKGYYLGPSLNYSLSDNAEISLWGQHLSLKESSFDVDNTTIFTRLKINF
jgi:hypothetical protein